MQALLQFIEKFTEFLGNHYLLAISFLVVLTLLIITEGRKAGKSITTQQATSLINRIDVE